MSLASFSVRRRVTTVMIFMAVALMGGVSLTRLSVDLFPEVELPTVTVVTYYFGASAVDVEEKITDVLEESLSVTTDLEEMSSVSQEDTSIITLQFAWGTSLDEVMNDVRTRIDFVQRLLPDDAEDPMLLRVDISMLPIMTLAVTSDRGNVQEQSDLVEEAVVARIERLDGVASVTALNQRERQVLVEVDASRLEDYGLSLEQVAGIIQMENLALPAGSVDVGRTTYSLRVPGEYQTIEELREVIVAQHEGGIIYLRDVAEVRDALEEASGEARVEGEPAIILLVQRESGANTADVVGRITALLDRLDEELPEHLRVEVLEDESVFVHHMVGHLTNVVYTGGILVVLIAFLFLRRWRTTLIVALTIPTCLVAVFAMLWARDYTLNAVSMASLAMAIGIVVDNSIVVIENVVRHVERGEPIIEASVRGTEEVSAAVVASSLTNVAIFAPVVFVTGLIGVFLDIFAYVVIGAVAMSLLVALLLAPALSSWLVRAKDTTSGARFQRLLGAPIDALERAYGKLIERVVASRGAIAAVVAIAVLAFAGSMVTSLFLGQDFLPSATWGNLSVQAELPSGTSAEHTVEVARRIERVIAEQVPEAEITYYSVGASRGGLDAGSGAAANVATVGARLPALADRDRNTPEIEAAIRPALERIPGVAELDVGGGPMGGGGGIGLSGRSLAVEIFSADPAEARRAAEKITSVVSQVRGVTDVSSDLAEESPELRIAVDRSRAARLGVPMAKVAAAVRLAVHGHSPTRFRGGDRDEEILVRLRPEDRGSVEAIRNLTVPSMAGGQVRLGNIAEVTEGSTPVAIRRSGGARAITVRGSASDRPLNEVREEVSAAIAAARESGEIGPEVETRFAGAVEDQRAMMTQMTMALLLAILLIYMVMAAQFESFLDPFVIMFSVPFGVTGVFLALLVTGTTLQATSLMGMIIIVGIVVNNAIVLIDYINEMRRQGMEMRQAVAEGGARRLRPVLMTSLTTIGGMVPLALAAGEGSTVWRPLGIACIGGLLLSTLVTLVLVPAVYVATERWRRIGRRDRAAARGVGEQPA